MQRFHNCLAIAALGAIATHATAGAWDYGDRVDRTDAAKARVATLQSDSGPPAGAPAAGGPRGRLAIRQATNGAPQVLLAVESAHILCGFGNECAVMVRFGDGKWERFSASKAAESESATLVIDDSPHFVELAKRATRIELAFTAYHAGTRVLEFSSPAPLAWDAIARP